MSLILTVILRDSSRCMKMGDSQGAVADFGEVSYGAFQ